MMMTKFTWRFLGKLLDVGSLKTRPYWFNSHAQAPNVVVFDSFFRVYFASRSPIDAKKQFVSFINFADFSGPNPNQLIRLASEPVLDLGEAGTFDQHGTYPMSVIREPERLVGVYGGWSRPTTVPFDVSLGLAFSVDGEKFSKYGSGPILTKSIDEPFVIASPKLRKFKDRYFLTYTAGREWTIENNRAEIFYRIRSAESLDLFSWKLHNRDLISTKVGDTEAQASPDIFENESGYHMFFCYRHHVGFRENLDLAYKIGYAFSENLLSWTRNDTMVEILNPLGKINNKSCSYPNIFRFNSQTYLLYLGEDLGRTGFFIAELEEKC